MFLIPLLQQKTITCQIVHLPPPNSSCQSHKTMNVVLIVLILDKKSAKVSLYLKYNLIMDRETLPMSSFVLWTNGRSEQFSDLATCQDNNIMITSAWGTTKQSNNGSFAKNISC